MSLSPVLQDFMSSGGMMGLGLAFFCLPSPVLSFLFLLIYPHPSYPHFLSCCPCVERHSVINTHRLRDNGIICWLAWKGECRTWEKRRVQGRRKWWRGEKERDKRKIKAVKKIKVYVWEEEENRRDERRGEKRRDNWNEKTVWAGVMVSQKSESHKECGGTDGIWESFMAHCRAKMGIQITLLALCANLHASMPPTGCTEGGAAAMEGGEEITVQWIWEKRWEGDFKERRALAGIEHKLSPTPNIYTTTTN